MRLHIKELKNKLLFVMIYSVTVGIFYFFDIPCLFLCLFKIPCPGCGMTRAVLSAFSLNFASAFAYHPMFWSLPIIILYFLKNGSLLKSKPADAALISGLAVGYLVNWILNLMH